MEKDSLLEEKKSEKQKIVMQAISNFLQSTMFNNQVENADPTMSNEDP